MGGNFCKTQVEDKSPQYFYRSVNENEVDIQNEKEKVKLVIEMINVTTDQDIFVKLTLYKDKNRTQFSNGGQTEKLHRNNNNHITFNQFFILDYYFEREQPITLFVNGGINETITTSLGSIMGSRGQKFIKQLSSGATLQVNTAALNNNNMKCEINCNISGNLKGMGLCYLIRYHGTQTNPINNTIYRSEIKDNPTNIKFNVMHIPSYFLAPNGDYNKNMVSVEIYDSYHKKKLGEQFGTFASFIGSEINLNIKNQIRVYMKFINRKEYTFLDFIRGGMQINLTIGIDFTSSNKPPNDPNSLHNITSKNMNSYEKAIRACGDILAFYDYDQLFPVYGYGAKLANSNEANHCFPINGNPNDPNINTIDGILLAYRQILPHITLYGPTYFAPIIRELNNTVKQELSEGKTMNYNILMILTDGLINDMDDTIDELVEASFLPISVIIIGIGNGDFGNMDILDADDDPLYDRNKRKADRDLVQFVPFFKYSNDGEKLAEQVLEEVPRQVIEYYQHNNIIPSDPIINI